MQLVGQSFDVIQNLLLTEAISGHAINQPDAIACTYISESGNEVGLSFGVLESSARILGAQLLGITERGSRALILLPSGLEFVKSFLGCLYSGIIAVPCIPPRANRSIHRLESVARDCNPDIVITTSAISSMIDRSTATTQFRGIKRFIVDDVSSDSFNEKSYVNIAPNEIAFLQYTSGSTGTPKGAVITHSNLAFNEVSIARAFGHDQDTVMISWLPIHHDMGLIGGLLQPLYLGAQTVLMSPSHFLRRPKDWLSAISRYRGTSSGAPNFGYDYCVTKIDDADLVDLDLSSWKVAYNGSEPIRSATLRNFVKKFSRFGFREEAFFPCYGLAEATLFVSGGPVERAPKILQVHTEQLALGMIQQSSGAGLADSFQEVVSCGQISEDFKIAIVDPKSGAFVSEGSVGKILLSGPSIAMGYYNSTDCAKKNLEFSCNVSGDGQTHFFDTGDLGFILENELYITGREKDLIIIRGRNVYPQDIEKAVEDIIDFVGPNSCAAFSIGESNEESLAIVIEADRRLVRDALKIDPSNNQYMALNLVRNIRNRISEEFDVFPGQVVFVRPGSFPRTTSGKVQRRGCKQSLLNDSLEVIFKDFVSNDGSVREPSLLPNAHTEATFDKVRSGVSSVVAEIVVRYLRANVDSRLNEIDHDKPLEQCGLDSIGIVDVALEIEKHFGIQISPDTLLECKTVETLSSYIINKSGAAITSRIKTRVAFENYGSADAVQLENSTNFDSQASVYETTEILTRSEQYEFFRMRNERIENFRQTDNYFFQTEIEAHEGSWVTVGGRRMLMMASYNYLGLNGHPYIASELQNAVNRFGSGVHGARLLAGTNSLHVKLERELAEFTASEACIVFNSGFLTSAATIACLLDHEDVVVGDEFIHASLVDGCNHSRAKYLTFKHNNLDDLRYKLAKSVGRRRLVVVDSVYSMEGDIAPIPDLISICREFESLLMVDEAHSLGVLGKTGRGVTEYFGLPSDAIDVKMGTLSKSLSSCGGYVAGSKVLVDYLKHNARGFIFSSAPTSSQMSAAISSLKLLRDEPQRVSKLHDNAVRFKKGMECLGYKLTRTKSPIVPVVFTSEEETLKATKLCRDNGLFVIPVFYPAVPLDSPRIRCSIMASHSTDDIDLALDVFKRVKTAMYNGI